MLQISLRLDDASRQQFTREFAHQNFAEQSPSQGDSVRGHAVAPDPLDGLLKFARSVADDGSLLELDKIKTDNQGS